MNAVEVLSNHHIKRTGCREGIIETVMASSKALSVNEIKEKLSGDYDRTTFYRSFKTLEEKNVIHKIVVNDQIVKYSLSNSITHKERHAHFYCNECHTVKCLESVPVAPIQLPEGYEGEEVDIIIKGVCDTCKKVESQKSKVQK